MIIKFLIRTLFGAAVGFIVGIIMSKTGGSCPLTCNPYRALIFGAIVGGLFALANLK